MNTLRAFTLAATLCVFGLYLSPQISSAADTPTGGVVTGELVITNAAQNRFRIVGHDGSFIAPAGTSTEELDGKAVQVELGRDGRVLRISEKAIHINPIAHGSEVVSGELVVGDAVQRTFTLAGDSRTYIAPTSMDIRPYAGRKVDVHLDENGRVTDLALAASAQNAPVTASCTEGDAHVANGSSICRDGTTFRCVNGLWVNVGTACS